jgi:hypothetical protein
MMVSVGDGAANEPELASICGSRRTSSRLGLGRSTLKHRLTADAHPTIQDLKAERVVKRFKAGVATQIDHVEPVELSKEAAHQLFAHSLVTIVRQHLEEWNEGAEHTVADCCHESNDSVAIKSKLHRIAPAQEIEVHFRRRPSWPVDEESAELVGTDRLGAIDVRDHGGDPSPDENRVALEATVTPMI